MTLVSSVNVVERRGHERSRVHVDQIAAEHDAEVFRMRFGKADVGFAGRDELRVEIVARRCVASSSIDA